MVRLKNTTDIIYYNVVAKGPVVITENNTYTYAH